MVIPKNSVASTRGWVHQRTGELLKASRMSQEQVDAWWANQQEAVAPAPVAPLHHNPQTLTEAPSVERTLSDAEISHHYATDHSTDFAFHHEDDEV